MENTRILAGIPDTRWGRAWRCKTISLMRMRARMEMESGNVEGKTNTISDILVMFPSLLLRRPNRDASLRYNEKEKESPLAEAATARKDPNADNKRDEAIAYVRDQKAKSGNGVSTLCIFFNATGETLYYDQEHSWYGRVWDLYPMEVQNGQWGAFLHVKNASTTSGSMAFVTYRVEANNNAGFCSNLIA
ncbi:hypothetical protein Tco_0613999 [Tanacetum coccineum]